MEQICTGRSYPCVCMLDVSAVQAQSAHRNHKLFRVNRSSLGGRSLPVVDDDDDVPVPSRAPARLLHRFCNRCLLLPLCSAKPTSFVSKSALLLRGLGRDCKALL